MKTILVDFDGVIHSYKSGWHGEAEIPDPPVPGALNFLRELSAEKEFEVCIYSSRNCRVEGRQAMIRWMRENGLEETVLDCLSFPTFKPPAFLTMDDRCICFKGQFPSMARIKNFQPWQGENVWDAQNRLRQKT